VCVCVCVCVCVAPSSCVRACVCASCRVRSVRVLCVLCAYGGNARARAHVRASAHARTQSPQTCEPLRGALENQRTHGAKRSQISRGSGAALGLGCARLACAPSVLARHQRSSRSIDAHALLALACARCHSAPINRISGAAWSAPQRPRSKRAGSYWNRLRPR